MKIKKFGTSKKYSLPVIISGIVFLLGIGAVTLYLLVKDNNNSLPTSAENINLSPATKEQKAAGEAAKEESIKRAGSAGVQSSPQGDLVQMATNYESTSKSLVVTSKLNNSVSWSECRLKLENSGVVKYYTARAVYQSDNSFCGGFTIPFSDLSTGLWKITLTALDINGKAYEKNTSVEIPS